MRNFIREERRGKKIKLKLIDIEKVFLFQINNMSFHHYLSFNQDGSCLACSTEDGFAVYTLPTSSSPLKLRFARNIGGSVGGITLYYRTNLLVCWGGKKYPCNRVVIWDDLQGKSVFELQYASEVRNVLMSRDRIVVVLNKSVECYAINEDFRQLRYLEQIPTLDNPLGICAIQTHSNFPFVLVAPGEEVGTITIRGDGLPGKTVKAHYHPIQHVALSPNGSYVATASQRGTMIRVFNVETGEKLYEFRRGIDGATIHSIVFDPETRYLAVSSDHGTVHIFELLPAIQVSQTESRIPYWYDLRSVSTVTLNDPTAKCLLKKDRNILLLFTVGSKGILSCYTYDSTTPLTEGSFILKEEYNIHNTKEKKEEEDVSGSEISPEKRKEEKEKKEK